MISVITVVYNGQKTLKRCFDSIINQTKKDFEFLVIDGGSTDGTVDIISDYEERFVKAGIRFKWISEPDRGMYDAINKGLRMATGDYIGILNSDDEYLPNTLLKVDDAIKSNPKTIIYGLIRRVENNQVLDVSGSTINRVSKQMIAHPSMFVPHEIYNSLNGYLYNFKLAADYEFVLRAFQAGYKFVFLEQVLAVFYLGGSSTKQAFRMARETNKIRYKYSQTRKYEYILREVQIWIFFTILKIINNSILKVFRK